MTSNAVYEYRKRREKRLAARGYKTKLNEYRKTGNGRKVKEETPEASRSVAEASGVRMDAPEKEQQNNNGGGGGGGGHGNTRLPFGLCKRFGIDIAKGWTPSDAWAALAGKGITASSAYTRLKQGKDPGKPIRGGEPVKPKEPKKTFTSRGKEYKNIEAKYYRWSGTPYKLTGTGTEDGGRFSRAFSTKEEMFKFLKDKGVEEFSDPETGEVVNPQEMDFSDVKFGIYDFPQKYFTGVTIGLRKGKYSVIGTRVGGKKEVLKETSSLAGAEKYLDDIGVAAEDRKMSPSVKKREKERLAWKDSDKVEYIEEDGVKYGDLKLEKTVFGDYEITGSSEDGEPFAYDCGDSRAKAMQYLKDHGVERVKSDDEFINPMEYEAPKTIATIKGRDYASLHLEPYMDDSFALWGIDIDGKKRYLNRQTYGETYDHFMQRALSDAGVGEDKITVSDEAKKLIEKKRKEDQERERRKAEFESKAISVGGERYTDVAFERDPYDPSQFRLIGYDIDGRKKNITSSDDMYTADKVIERWGLDKDSVLKDPEIKEAYDKYMEYKRDYEAKAVKYMGHRYADLHVVGSGAGYKIFGKDIRGRERVMSVDIEYEDFQKTLRDIGISEDDIPMDDRAKEIMEKDKKVKKALETGEYYREKTEREAYKDLHLEKTGDHYSVKGTDTDDKLSSLETDLTYDDAIEYLEEALGCHDYKIHAGGKVYDRPPDGMHKCILMRTTDGFKVLATTGSGESKEVYHSSDEQEARKWLSDKGIDSSGIKTRGMNPNDDVPRTHTEKSLSDFDTYRMARIEKSFLDTMTDQEKNDAAEMLTDIFSQGAYRVARSTESFEKIIENGYKSQVEIGRGGDGAAQNPELRKKASQKFFGHKGLDETEYEKCGYLGLPDDAEDWDDSAHPCYGGDSPLTYTLKKENMKDRTTYTYGDSLNTRDRMSSAGYAGDKPTIEGLSSLYGKSYVNDAVKVYKQYKEGKISYQEMFKKIRSKANNGYIELQFHGPVTVKDIDKVTFKKQADLEYAFSYMDETRRKNVIKTLQSNGVKMEFRTKRGEPFQDGWELIRKKYPADFSD